MTGQTTSPLGKSPSERKLVTVLVADTVGSTALAESMDPEEWTGIMFEAHERMKKAIHAFGGTVAQFTGDGVIAFFGAPRTREDDAVRAVYAALELQKSLKEYGDGLVKKKRVPHFEIRAGLHSGTVIVGDMGNAQYSEYLAVGDTVTLAQRVQSAAEPGKVALSNETAQMVASAFELDSKSEIAAGPGQMLCMWQVREARANVLRDPTEKMPLVGREREMERLKGALNRLDEGRGALISIVGEAGVGKSRLAEELRTYAQGHFEAVNWFEARGVSFGGGIYALFQQILRASLGIGAQEPVDAIRQRLMLGAQRQKFQDPELVVHMLELMLAIDEKKDTARFPALEGEGAQRELFDVVRNTKRALARNRPTVFVLEEMHWADVTSVELTLNDADLVRDLPLVILATFRPDRDAPSFNYRQECLARFKDVYVEVELEPLGDAEANGLLDSFEESAGLTTELRGKILAKTEGNPFFMEQLVRSLVEAGALVKEDGEWKAQTDLAEIALPNSLNAVLAARIDRLSEPTRRVLQAASVIGRGFPYELLRGVLARAGWADLAEALALHLGVLERQELVVARETEGEKGYQFKHALIQDAAYGSLLKKRRRDLHRFVYEAMLEMYAGREDEHAAELASHAQAGEEWRQTYEWARRAAENATKVFALNEARAEYKRALGALDKVETSETEKRAVRGEIERAMAVI